MTEREEIKFTEIVQMIADGTVPEGAKFITDDDCVATMQDSENRDELVLAWERKPFGMIGINLVQFSEDIANSQWHMEVPEKQLTLTEAIEEWRKGNKVKVVFGSSADDISSYTDLDTIWEVTELGDLDDLLFHSEYYKVQ